MWGGSCPRSTAPLWSSSRASTLSSVPPPQSILSHPLPVRGIPSCPLCPPFALAICLRQKSLSGSERSGLLFSPSLWCWEWELAAEEGPQRGVNTSAALLETPCRGFPWAGTLLLLTKAASAVKGCSLVRSGPSLCQGLPPAPHGHMAATTAPGAASGGLGNTDSSSFRAHHQLPVCCLSLCLRVP